MNQAISERLEMPERKKSRDTGEHTNTSASYNKGENKKIASDFDACYPILFRKVYNLKSNTFQQVSCKIIHDVVGFVNRYGGKVEKN